jgi:flagellar hook protein FlgE
MMIDAIGIALGGLDSATQKVTKAANTIASLGTTAAGDTVDLSAEAVNLLLAETEFKANVSVIKTAEELSDDLLSIFDEKV